MVLATVGTGTSVLTEHKLYLKCIMNGVLGYWLPEDLVGDEALDKSLNTHTHTHVVC